MSAGNMAESDRVGDFRVQTAGVKHDDGKVRPTLFPWESMRPVLAVLEFGARKYSPGGWRTVGVERYANALLRHTIAWQLGESCDEESGLPHLWHMATNALFLVAFDLRDRLDKP